MRLSPSQSLPHPPTEIRTQPSLGEKKSRQSSGFGRWRKAVGVLIHFSHVRLFATPWTVACQAPLSSDSPARILEWVAVPSCRGSSGLRDQTWISCLGGRFFTAEPLEKLCRSWNLSPGAESPSHPLICWTILQAACKVKSGGTSPGLISGNLHLLSESSWGQGAAFLSSCWSQY